ncbi:unnamed protein product [Diatraea saccharalis]|uniref:unspecific monooxygenase n=1 Tax=Diatraea saccharalis TaxID=40085 RepID=A0A9N9WD27_9NEOP|nr:unnamed protein product [Diatraea saccharalis]
MLLLWIWCLVLLVVLWLYLRRKYSQFSDYGVRHLRPVPLLGNMTRLLFRMEHSTDFIDRMYKAFPNERFIGLYEFVSPAVIVKDIELLKKITVKDFEHFLDHRAMIDEKTDPFFGRNLFFLKGQEWKDMRSTLSPAFTSSKMRLMLPFMVNVGHQMIETLKKKIKNSKTNYVDVDCKDLTTRFANDVIASCAFGLKVDSLVEENNDFYKMGKEASTFTFKQLLLFFAVANFPKIMKILNITFFSDTVTNFFKHLVLNTMNERESHQIIRPDMIHLLMEAKKGKLTHEDNTINGADAGFAAVEESNVGKNNVNRVWTDDDLVAQAIIFFVAGFETVSSAMSFTLHELAVNPDVQDVLVAEIRENEKKNGGKFDYNSIQNMVYMDMVVSEALRLWPAALGLDRVCTKDYNLGRANDKCDKDYIIHKGEGIFLPIWCIHRDPRYYPNPNKFDPERFSEENRHRIQPFTYLPFGAGPRNCIGSRFALCEVKVMIYQLLQHIEISPSDKTAIPVKLCKNTFNLKIEGGHWVRMKIRE